MACFLKLLFVYICMGHKIVLGFGCCGQWMIVEEISINLIFWVKVSKSWESTKFHSLPQVSESSNGWGGGYIF